LKAATRLVAVLLLLALSAAPAAATTISAP
jgi:hypothetical protein